MVLNFRFILFVTLIILSGSCRTRAGRTDADIPDTSVQKANENVDPGYLKLAGDIQDAGTNLQNSGACQNPSDDVSKAACESARNFAQAGQMNTTLASQSAAARNEINQSLKDKLGSNTNFTTQQLAGFGMMGLGGVLVAAGGITYLMNSRNKKPGPLMPGLATTPTGPTEADKIKMRDADLKVMFGDVVPDKFKMMPPDEFFRVRDYSLRLYSAGEMRIRIEHEIPDLIDDKGSLKKPEDLFQSSTKLKFMRNGSLDRLQYERMYNELSMINFSDPSERLNLDQQILDDEKKKSGAGIFEEKNAEAVNRDLAIAGSPLAKLVANRSLIEKGAIATLDSAVQRRVIALQTFSDKFKTASGSRSEITENGKFRDSSAINWGADNKITVDGVEVTKSEYQEFYKNLHPQKTAIALGGTAGPQEAADLIRADEIAAHRMTPIAVEPSPKVAVDDKLKVSGEHGGGGYAGPVIMVTGLLVGVVGAAVGFSLADNPNSPANVYIMTLADISQKLDALDKATGNAP